MYNVIILILKLKLAHLEYLTYKCIAKKKIEYSLFEFEFDKNKLLVQT